MELKAITGQLYITNGTPQATTAVPGLLTQASPAKAAYGRSRDYLFIHLTLSGPASETEQLAQDLLDGISQRFYQTSGSVTAALRNAIVETNELLLRRNMSGSDAHREGAISCAVLRGQELFMAQVGESFAVLGQNIGVVRMPASPPARVTPLGRTAGLDVRFYHHWLEVGQTLLLADPRIAHLPLDQLKPHLSEVEEIQNSLDGLQTLLTSDTARLLLIHFTDEELVGTAPTIPIRTKLPFATQTVVAPNAGTPPPSRPTPPRPNLNLESTARHATAQTAKGLGKFTGWLADLLNRLAPEREATPEVEPPHWAVPALLAITIPLIVTIIVTAVFIQRGRARDFSLYRQEMSEAIGLAQQADDPETARDHYNQVLVLAVEAETIRPGNSDIAQLRTTALTGLDSLDGVTRLNVQTLYTYPEGTNLTSVVLREGLNGDLYTLDMSNIRVWLHETAEDYLTFTNSEPQLLLFNNQAIGNHTIGSLLDMTWRPTGQNVSRENLSILDSQGVLISYYPDFNDFRAVPLGLASDWRQPKAMTTFSERLYLLDPAVPAIWRYFPDGDAFTLNDSQQTVEFAEDSDLGQLVDIAIYSEDGSVILLYRDGRLRRFVSGRPLWTEKELLDNGLQSPLIAPSAVKIIGQGLNSSIFVADPGSARILQFSLGGIFLAQYKATLPDGTEAFANTSDFTVAETPLRIFVVTGNRLLVATEP